MIRGAIAIVTCAAALATAVPAEAQGTPEGIHVRGHWALEVRNADGSLARRAEFDNALLGGGQAVLVSLLGRAHSMGRWRIILVTQQLQGRQHPFGPSYQFALAEADDADADRYPSARTLTVSTDVTSAAALQLRGAATAVERGVITAVKTAPDLCGGTSVAKSCFPTDHREFSQTTVPGSTPPGLPDGLLIEAGQILQVTVTITFAAAPHQPPSH